MNKHEFIHNHVLHFLDEIGEARAAWADKAWELGLAVVDFLDQPMLQGCGLVWPKHTAPQCCLDLADHREANISDQSRFYAGIMVWQNETGEDFSEGTGAFVMGIFDSSQTRSHRLPNGAHFSLVYRKYQPGAWPYDPTIIEEEQ